MTPAIIQRKIKKVRAIAGIFQREVTLLENMYATLIEDKPKKTRRSKKQVLSEQDKVELMAARRRNIPLKEKSRG